MLEEWRSGRDSVGRTHEAHWKTLLEGTKVGCAHMSPVKMPRLSWHDSHEALQSTQLQPSASDGAWQAGPRGCCVYMQYAERLPIGLKEIVETVPASTVHAFYRRWYRPENMAVIIAGDFDPATVQQLLEAAMSTCHWPDVSPTPVPK